MSASSNVRPDVGQFFERFEKASATLDVVTLEEMFEEQFLNLDPRSAAPFTRAALIAALPMREKMFASIGAARAALVGMSESPLDDRHTLVHTSWAVDFPEGVADEALTLTSTFLLRRASGGSTRAGARTDRFRRAPREIENAAAFAQQVIRRLDEVQQRGAVHIDAATKFFGTRLKQLR